MTPDDYARMSWHRKQKFRRRVAAERRPLEVLHIQITQLPSDAEIGRRIRHMARQIEPHIPRDPVDVIEQRRDDVVAEASRAHPTGPTWRRSPQAHH